MKLNLKAGGLYLSLIASLFLLSFVAEAQKLPAFPGAIGFGSTSVGGSGRHLAIPKTTVFRVTSLADSGPHTLRACAELSEPRVCIFETSGRIVLKDKIEITAPYLTIAGQTAPPPGILITGAGLKISAHNVVVRHLAIRPGDSPVGPKPLERDGLAISGSSWPVFNVIVDHLSLTWALDENAATYGDHVADITISNSIISEGLYRSIHPDGPHSMGVLINEGSRRISIHGCLFAHNNDRNPRQKADSSLEFFNNLVYNWGGTGSAHQANVSDTAKTNLSTLLNFAGNYYLPGPNSPLRAPLYAKPISQKLRVFVAHNIGPEREKNLGNEWKITNLPEAPFRSLEPTFPLSGVAIGKAEETLERVLNDAGSRPYARDSVDRRIVTEVRSKVGSLKDCIANCPRNVGGWPETAVNVRKLSPPETIEKDSNGNGYTDLEDWLNCYAEQLETATPVSPHTDSLRCSGAL